MIHIASIFIVFCATALVWYLYRNDGLAEKREAPASKVRHHAYELVKSDSRLAQAVMLLSYADVSGPEVVGVRRRSNRRLILEVRQIVRQHFPEAQSETINLISAQLLIIAANIGRKRRRKNADMSMPQRN